MCHGIPRQDDKEVRSPADLLSYKAQNLAMDSTESCVPPGFRFHPTDEELVGYYLRKKVASQKIDLDVIRDIDLYRIEPWDLLDQCHIGHEEQNGWYFFSHKDKKYPTGTRTNRATMAGFWKATGRDKAVHDKTKLIGMRKTLVFYKGRAPNGQKTDWIMHEYRLESDENAPPQEEGWVVCRAFKKRSAACAPRTAAADAWDSSYGYDELARMSNIFSPVAIEYHPSRAQSVTSLLCNQEIELDNLNILQQYASQFVQLPELESPSLPTMKQQQTSPSVVASWNEETGGDQGGSSGAASEKVVDWRTLDKFVASQLSYEKSFAAERVVSDFGGAAAVDVDDSSDMALLLLQNGKEEAEEIMNGCLSSGSSALDVGICIFDQ